MSGHVALLALVAGFTGISIIVAIETTRGVSALDDHIIIDKPAPEVFRALVEPNNIDKISQNISQVKLETKSPLATGSSYKRILYSHGIPNYQTVTVAEFEQDRLLTTKTTLVGFDVTYHYELTSTADGKTLLALKKEGQGGWLVLRPLLIHLLTRPEHDGDHLTRIKRLVESTP